ncbi:stage 0 sporulation family protein [Psychrilyobacter sp. S5]|nr:MULTISPECIES: stage 0 sporulation family protein [Psychrilyobacter]MCS5420842.1 stage 0 sporulation family protein [Psychrilyobacter sp. S5]
MNKSNKMTIEEKMAMRLKEKNSKKNLSREIIDETPKDKVENKKNEAKSKSEPVKKEIVKPEIIKKEKKVEEEDLAMPAPAPCGTEPCDENCAKKKEAKEELNREILDEEWEAEKKAAEDKKKKEKKQYKILGIMFEITRKRYYFEVVDEVDYKIGDRAIVDTARGKEIGLVYMAPKMMGEESLVLPLKPVIRKATAEDNQQFETLKAEAEKANNIGKEKIKKHELPMKLVATEFTFDKSKLIFYFTAEGRIDFRNLVKELATIFKLRIELRQIGVRDEARILGSLGICGKELCCRIYINKFDSVLIKMARDQGLVINPSKISGACGRLLCCIKYEYQQYADALLKCPSMGQTVNVENSKGRVVGINPLNEYLYVDVEGKGRMRLNLDEVSFDKKEARKQHKSKKKTPEEAAMKGLEAK